LWGRKNNIQTSTVHDAFFTNVSDMLAGRRALREIYANAIENNSIEATLLEMRKRGLPKELYEKYLEEAKDIGLIPVVGRSVIDGKLMTEADILKKADILASVPERFKDNRYFYGIG
jgi:GNAT superfamily N-acetyltransferase